MKAYLNKLWSFCFLPPLEILWNIWPSGFSFSVPYSLLYLFIWVQSSRDWSPTIGIKWIHSIFLFVFKEIGHKVLEVQYSSLVSAQSISSPH